MLTCAFDVIRLELNHILFSVGLETDNYDGIVTLDNKHYMNGFALAREALKPKRNSFTDFQ